MQASSLQGRLFALEEDLQARAISVGNDTQVIDYPAFVALSLNYDKVNSWL
ncbi:Protein TusB [compost metagenome]